MLAILSSFESILCRSYSDRRECWVAVSASGRLVRWSYLPFTFPPVQAGPQVVLAPLHGVRKGPCVWGRSGFMSWKDTAVGNGETRLPHLPVDMRFPSSVRPTSLLVWFAFYFTQTDLIKTSCTWIRFEVWSKQSILNFQSNISNGEYLISLKLY